MSLDQRICDVVEAAVERKVGRYLSRLADPEPLVYSVRETAEVLRTSTKTVRRLLSEGVLPTVPHMGQRILIPRKAVQCLVDSAAADGADEASSPVHQASIGLGSAG